MTPVSFSDLATAIGGELVGCSDPNSSFGRVEIDSRRVRPGDLFWALKGEHHDGHDFVHEAQQCGAVAAVVRHDSLTRSVSEGDRSTGFTFASRTERSPSLTLRVSDDAEHRSTALIAVHDTQKALEAFARWYRSRHESLVIGVTGSFGKTTTREMIHAVLSAKHPGVRSLKNFNNHIGLPLSLLELDASHEFAVLEMGASAVGEIAALAEIARPEIGVITGIGLAHVEGFGSPGRVVLGKGELLESLPASGFAVIPGDDSITRGMAKRTSANTLFVGEHDGNQIQASRIRVQADRLQFEVDGFEYSVPVVGRHFIRAALSALAIAREIGLTPEEINSGFQNFKSLSGRCEVQQIGSWTVIDDSYNANPESMFAACQTLRDWDARHRRLLVTGDMLELGEHAAQSHFEMGLNAAQAGIDLLLAYGEHANDVIRGAMSGGLPANRLAQCDHFEVLLTALDCLLDSEDVLLVKGSRGMRMERVVDWLRGRVGEGEKGRWGEKNTTVGVPLTLSPPHPSAPSS